MLKYLIALVALYASSVFATQYCLFGELDNGVIPFYQISPQTKAPSLDLGYSVLTGNNLNVSLITGISTKCPVSNPSITTDVGSTTGLVCYFIDNVNGYHYATPLTLSGPSNGTCTTPTSSSLYVGSVGVAGFPTTIQCGDQLEVYLATSANSFAKTVGNLVTTTVTPCDLCLPLPSISPATSGTPGQTITVTGSFFYASTIGCTFTDIATATPYFSTATFVSKTTVTCPVPSGMSAGSYNFTVNFASPSATATDTTACPIIFNFTTGGGHSDPHFHGFNGEKMEIKRDENAANQLFHIYCSPSVTVTTLFYEYSDKLLFMTRFWVRLGETLFTLNLSTKPKMLSSGYEGPIYNEENGRFRIDIQGGHLEWDDNMLRVVYGYLKINFSSKLYLNNSPYMNIDITARDKPTETKVTGIVGRTLFNKLSNEEFEQYLPFKASVSDVVSFSCSSLLDTLN